MLTQLKMKFKLFIKTKMLESRIFHTKMAFKIYERERCHACLSCA